MPSLCKKGLALLCLLALVFCACDPVSDYVTKGVDIRLQVPGSSVSAASVKVNIVPDNDRVYYYCGIMPDSAFTATYDQRFMEYVLDSVYLDYIQWRKELLAESSPYVAPFSSHCLSYGQDSRTFSGLTPETNYLIYAFCVNPETNQPMGELFRTTVRTDAYYPVDLTFTYSIERKADGCWLTLEPSDDAHPYVWDIVSNENVTHYGGVAGYVEAYLDMFRETGQTRYVTTKGYAYYNMTTHLEQGVPYTLMMAGYDGNFTTAIHYRQILFSDTLAEVLHSEFDTIPMAK